MSELRDKVKTQLEHIDESEINDLDWYAAYIIQLVVDECKEKVEKKKSTLHNPNGMMAFAMSEAIEALDKVAK